MKVKIIAVGKFEYLENGDEKIELEIDLMEMHNEDSTFEEIITEAFEKKNSEGCSCSFSESQNHCDCDGHGYEYEYTLHKFEKIEE
jgi:hypothetical protein